MLRNISYSVLVSILCLLAFVSVTRSGEVIVTKKTVQEIDANGNITNKTYITKTTKESVSEIKSSLVATSVQNETLLFDGIQKYRKEKKNKNILQYSSKLAWISRDFAKELSTNNYFDHTSKAGDNGRIRLDRWWMKENTYWWEILAQAISPEQALQAFKDSKIHNGIMLEDLNYTTIGVGYYQGTWVVMFFTDKKGKYADKEQPKVLAPKKFSKKKK